MCSPVGHSLIGIAVAQFLPKQSMSQKLFWFLFVMFCANGPDLDFAAGWLVGDFNRYHHYASHSLTAAVLFSAFGVLAATVMRWPVLFTALAGSLIYACHIGADMLTTDRVAPIGMQLLWPFSQDFYISPVTIFQPVAHGHVGDDTRTVFARIFSPQNGLGALKEILITSPLLLLGYLRYRNQ